MDRFVSKNLEAYLSGQLGEVDRLAFERRLERNPQDREAVRHMTEISGLFGTLEAPESEVPGPSVGFHLRVLRQIREEAQTSVWNWFLQPGVVRRVALASAAWLALLISGIASQTIAQPSTSRVARAVLAERPESADYCNVRLGCDIDVNRSSMLAAVIVTGSSGR